MDVKTDLERWREVSLTVDIEGKSIDAKGRVNFFYRGQPYHCRNCQETHIDKCPQFVAKQVAEQEGENKRVEQKRSLLIGDSNLRRVNKCAFYAKTDCATGAKIGHIANSLSFVDKNYHYVVIVHAGQNNVLQEESVDVPEWQNKMQLEVKTLQSKL